jgi:hypothetical protein
MNQFRAALGLGAFVTACASSTPGAKPHDMSAAQHEAMAQREEQAAQLHSAEYNPALTVKTERCRSSARGDLGGCWTSVTNPTAEHLDEAKKHHKMAEDHRAASQALRDAEARACAGVPGEDRDMSPFEHREDITRVTPLMVNVPSGKAHYSKMEGAIISFRAVPGMTAQWLQRVVDCHIARNAALGHVVPEMPDCPLVPKNVTAHVRPTETGFDVEVQSADPDSATEVLARAKRLVP